MRIAIIPSAYHPALGGVEHLTRSLVTHLSASGDDVEVWTTQHPPDLPAMATVDDIHVRRFSFYLPPARPAALAALPRRARLVLRQMLQAALEFKPDVLHVQCFGINGVYALALSELRRIPLVVSLQGETVMDDHDIYDRSWSLRAGLRLALRRAAVVTACSQFALDDACGRFGSSGRQGRVIFNGVDIDSDEKDAPFDLPASFVLALGRSVEKKGFDLLLRAFALLPEDCRSDSLVIAGDGPELARLRALASELGLGGRAIFSGRLDRGEVAWAMRRAKVFVLPSRVEPFGIVTLEAMAAGCPVLVSERGGAPEIVRPGVDGVTVDPFDTGAFADALATLLRDADLRQRLGVAGRHRVRDFDWSTITRQYRSTYALAMLTGQ